jgi:hypothetical protein
MDVDAGVDDAQGQTEASLLKQCPLLLGHQAYNQLSRSWRVQAS